MAVKQVRARSGAMKARAVGAQKKPVRARAQRLSPDQRREQLLKCALQVFSEKGLGDGKHADLAQAAAVAVPTAFHYFPTREDLIKATLDEVSRFLIHEIVARNVDLKLPAPLTVKQILLNFTDSIEEHPHHIRVWLEWSSAIRDGLWDLYLVFYKDAIRRMKAILNRGKRAGEVKADVDSDDAARIIVGLAHMITQMKFAGNSRATIEHTIDSLVQGYLGGWQSR